MDFEGFRFAMRKDVLRIIRDRPTERHPPPPQFGMTPGPDFFDIPWEYILRAQGVINGNDRLILTYIHSFSKLKPPEYEPRSYEFILRPASTDPVDYIAKVLNFAARRHSHPPIPRFKIFINPKAGRGKALKVFTTHVKPFLLAAGCNIVNEIQPGKEGSISHVCVTTGPKAAMNEATALNINAYDAILCVGGDGTVNEVVNGLANRPDARKALEKLPIATIPAGSGNALSTSLFGACHPTYAAWQAVKGKTIRADLMSIVPVVNDGAPLPPIQWAFMSLSFGWIAHADIHTEALRFMGDARFTAGIVWQVTSRARYQASLAVHGSMPDHPGTWWEHEAANRRQLKDAIVKHYNGTYMVAPYRWKNEPQGSSMVALVGSKRPQDHWEQKGYPDMLSFYAGKLPWTARDAMAFPAALSNDGYIDLCILHGKVGLRSMTKIFTSFGKGEHFNHEDVTYMKVKSFKLVPGVNYTGQDVAEIQPYARPQGSSDGTQNGGQTYQKRADVDRRKFRSKFVLSVDGERMDPSHGVVCEVQEGLVKFISDSGLQKYQPTVITKVPDPQPNYTPADGTLSDSDSEDNDKNYKSWGKGLDSHDLSQPSTSGGIPLLVSLG